MDYNKKSNVNAKDRVIKSTGKYNMNFIDWNNEWERVSEIENKLDNGEVVSDEEEAKRVKYFRDKESEKYGVLIDSFEIVKNVDIKKECYICLKYFSRSKIVRRLPCKHIFCHECLAPWVKTHYNCPTCKYMLKNDPDEDDS